MSDEWMDSVRWSYINRIRLMALQQGLVLVKVPSDPSALLKDYRAPEWACEEDAPCLYVLLDEEAGDTLFSEGITIGDVEDYLTTGPRATWRYGQAPPGD